MQPCIRAGATFHRSADQFTQPLVFQAIGLALDKAVSTPYRRVDQQTQQKSVFGHRPAVIPKRWSVEQCASNAFGARSGSMQGQQCTHGNTTDKDIIALRLQLVDGRNNTVAPVLPVGLQNIIFGAAMPRQLAT